MPAPLATAKCIHPTRRTRCSEDKGQTDWEGHRGAMIEQPGRSKPNSPLSSRRAPARREERGERSLLCGGSGRAVVAPRGQAPRRRGHVQPLGRHDDAHLPRTRLAHETIAASRTEAAVGGFSPWVAGAGPPLYVTSGAEVVPSARAAPAFSIPACRLWKRPRGVRRRTPPANYTRL